MYLNDNVTKSLGNEWETNSTQQIWDSNRATSGCEDYALS